jgi:tellurite resistance protein
VAAAVLLVLAVIYAARGVRGVLADLRDPVLGPFVPVSVITAMLLGSALSPYSLTASRVLVVVFLIATIGVGGWLPASGS